MKILIDVIDDSIVRLILKKLVEQLKEPIRLYRKGTAIIHPQPESNMFFKYIEHQSILNNDSMVNHLVEVCCCDFEETDITDYDCIIFDRRDRSVEVIRNKYNEWNSFHPHKWGIFTCLDKVPDSQLIYLGIKHVFEPIFDKIENIFNGLLYEIDHDDLTGLFNYRHLYKLILEDRGVLLNYTIFGIINLLELKSFNDVCGWSNTDIIIRKIAQLLSVNFGENYLLFRNGAKFFVFSKSTEADFLDNFSNVTMKIEGIVDLKDFEILKDQMPCLKIILAYTKYDNNYSHSLQLIEKELDQMKKNRKSIKTKMITKV